MSRVFDGDALQAAMVLGCRPGYEVIGMRLVGQNLNGGRHA